MAALCGIYEDLIESEGAIIEDHDDPFDRDVAHEEFLRHGSLQSVLGGLSCGASGEERAV